MRFTPWATRLVLMLSLSATVVLTACGGGGGGGGTAPVRLLNASSFSQLDMLVNDKAVNSQVAYGTVGSYGDVDINNPTFKFATSGTGTAQGNPNTPTLIGGTNYTYVVYGATGAFGKTLLQESETAPDSGKAKLLVLNQAPDAGALDIYVALTTDATNSLLSSNLQGSTGTGYLQVNSGTFRIRVTGYNRPNDVRLDIPSVTLDSASVNTLVLSTASFTTKNIAGNDIVGGGTLVNGIHLIQKGAAKNLPNGLSRVRVVNAMAGTPTVSVAINGNTILPASQPPNTTEYATFTAGQSTLVVMINGSPMTVASPSFTAGGDYTLLLSGTTATPQLVALPDDNRLPGATTGNVKIRLINGLSNPSALTTLNVDFQSVASNVAPGTSSTPTPLPASTGSVITVNTPTQANPLYNPSAGTASGLTPLVANGVYTLFIMGDPADPKGKFSKDR